jgi:hypothetical protein
LSRELRAADARRNGCKKKNTEGKWPQPCHLRRGLRPRTVFELTTKGVANRGSVGRRFNTSLRGKRPPCNAGCCRCWPSSCCSLSRLCRRGSRQRTGRNLLGQRALRRRWNLRRERFESSGSTDNSAREHDDNVFRFDHWPRRNPDPVYQRTLWNSRIF